MVKLQKSAAVLVLCIGTVFAELSTINRLDIFDASENHLLFVTFSGEKTRNFTERLLYLESKIILDGTAIEVSVFR